MAAPEKADSSAWFFKTGAGHYAEGDKFIGVTVPEQRRVAKSFSTLELDQIEKLLLSPIHEERLTALLILVSQHEKADGREERRRIYDFYCDHLDRVNNWDLVDSSAPHIVGPHAPLSRLRALAKADNIWHRRVAILATFHHIRLGNPRPTLAIAELLVDDEQDLIHKAVGWMLREVGKHFGRETEEVFLRRHYDVMPRTMLRYAIERFPEDLRQQYLKGTVPA